MNRLKKEKILKASEGRLTEAIENYPAKPKVSKEFISRWQEKIEIETDAGGTVHPSKWQLIEMLHELGFKVEVEE